MAQIFLSKFRQLLILAMFVVAAGAVSLATPQTAYSAGFADDVAGKTTIKLKDIPGVGDALNKLKLGKLANMDMAGVTATEKTISGFINFFAMRWNFLVFKGGTETYFAMEPLSATGQKRTPKLSDFFKVPGIEVTDMLTFDRMVWVVAARGAELEQNKLPAAAKAMFTPYFDDNAAFEVSLDQGITFMAMSDIGKLKPLKDAIEAIGGKSSKALFKAQLSTGVLSAVMDGKTPSITASFLAALPPIRPRIGKKIEIPATFTVGLKAEFDVLDASTKFGFFLEAGDVPFAYPDIAKKKIATAKTTMDIEVAMALEGGKPTFSIAATMFKGKDGAFKKAFGLPFIDLQDYTMAFEIKPDAVAIGIGAGGRFYDNNIVTFAAVQVPAATSGIPIPEQIKFMVSPTDPNKIASLSLKDLTAAFADLTNAVTGSKIPHPPIPDDFVRIGGVKTGEGPFIDVSLSLGLDAGLEMAGNLIVFGTKMGEVETAVIKPTHGIEIKAKTQANLPIDIIKLPQGEVDIAITVENITNPHVRIKTETVSLLGSGGSFELSIDKKAQVAIIEGAAPFGLFDASLVLESNTRSLKNAGFTATGIIEGNFFNRFADGIQTATADFSRGVETAVSGMNRELHVASDRIQKAKIGKSKAVGDLEQARKSAYAEFNKAKAEVNKLKKKYDREKGKCSPKPWDWDHCVAAGSLWTAMKVARGVLDIAQKVVDEFLKGTGKVLSAVIDGLNKTINAFGKVLAAASDALSTAMVTFGNAIEFAGKFAGQALSAIASVFDIEKLWMKGKLAVLNASQKGELGIEYTLLGTEYLKDIKWDFNVPVEKVFEVFVPGADSGGGSKGKAAPLPGNMPAPVKVAGSFTFNPVTGQQARNYSESLIESGKLKATAIPFDPGMCETHPYALDQHIKLVNSELSVISRRTRNAQAYKYVTAMEASRAFRALGNGAPVNPARWVKVNRGGRIPSGAISGGSEPGRSRLYVCRSKYKGNWASGKVVAGYCNIGFYGKEHRQSTYDVLVGTSSRVGWTNGNTRSAMYVGKEKGKNVYVCRVRYKGGTHPGKIAPNKNCYIGYGGKERGFKSGYQTMTVNRAGLHNYTGLVNQYKAAKTSVAQRDSTAKYTSQGRILSGIAAELKKAPGSGAPRKEVERNYKSRPRGLKEQLDPVFLGNQEKELRAMRVNLLKLQKDPASACGQAIRDAGVKPVQRKSSGGGGGGFAGMSSALKNINKQAAAAVQQAMQASATAVAAANAARMLQTKQAAARKKQQTAYKKKRLLAFTAKLKKREASMAKRVAKTTKVRAARSKVAVKKVVRTVSANKAAALAASKATKGAQKKKSQSKALAKLSQKQRAAFARSWGKKKVAAKKGVSAGKVSSARLAKRQQRMAKRLSKVAGMNAQQKKAFAVAYSKSRARGRATMLKSAPVSRASTLGNKPKGATAATPPARAGVNTKMLRQLNTLKALAK
ncbi:MAG: hypothetical protein ACI9JL_000826 [Paracoccaceae bacterium]|jgi:hypothetical protein